MGNSAGASAPASSWMPEMTAYLPVKERFRHRIAAELRLLAERARAGGEGPCFWVLSNQAPDEDEPVRQSGRFRKAGARSPGRCAAGTDTGPDPLVPSRFIQVLLDSAKPYFVLDLPSSTLDENETEMLLRDRLGFVRAKERPALGYDAETLEAFDPVCKQYLVEDEERAAEDIAYVLFDLWALAPDASLFVSTARADGCKCWFERDADLDELEIPRPAASVGCPRCLGLVVAGGGE